MPSDVRFADVVRMLRDAGWTLDRVSGSHHMFSKAGESPIVVPVHRKKVKHVYVAKARKIIDGGKQEGPRS